MIVNDIDEEEIKKPSVRCHMPVHADAKELLERLNEELDQMLAQESGLPQSVSAISEYSMGGKAFRG